ncbi:indole-3-glycerol phosphate synthase TrpC, partial [Xanthomonas campestris]
SLQTTLDMRAAVPRDRALVTESGIVTAPDVQLMRSTGVNAFLVGETSMRAPEPGEALRQLFFAHD